MMLKFEENSNVECECLSELFFIKMMKVTDRRNDGRDWNITWVCALCDHNYDMQEFLGLLAKNSPTRHGKGVAHE